MISWYSEGVSLKFVQRLAIWYLYQNTNCICTNLKLKIRYKKGHKIYMVILSTMNTHFKSLNMFSMLYGNLTAIPAHHCFGPPFLSVGSLLSTGGTMSSFFLPLCRVGVNIISFSRLHLLETRPALY